MKREEKYPSTKTFYFYNANPKNKYTGDCVIRAISTALEQDYNVTYKELFELSLKTGYFISNEQCYIKYIEGKGWKKNKQPRKKDNTKYTGTEFCKKIAEKNQNIIAHLGGNHIVAIIDKRVYDTWDSTDGCIGNYWTR